MESEEVLFVSQITYTPDVVRQSVRFALKAFFVVYVLLPILVTFLGVLILIDSNAYYMLFAGIVLLIVMPIIIVQIYNKSVKTTYNRALEQNNGQEATNVLRFNDKDIFMVNKQTGNKVTYPYSCIRRLVIKNNLIMLVTATKVMLLADKNKFDIGTPEDFIEFINKKIQTNNYQRALS